MKGIDTRIGGVEISASIDLWGWGLGVSFQVGHGWFPWAFTVEIGPALFGVWYHMERRKGDKQNG